MLLEPRTMVFAGVRAALIRVMEETGLGTPRLECHLQVAERQVPVIDGTDRPAHDEARIEVENRSQMKFATHADAELRGIAEGPETRTVLRDGVTTYEAHVQSKSGKKSEVVLDANGKPAKG